MTVKRSHWVSHVLVFTLFAAGCGVAQETAQKPSPAGLIATPAAYYSSPKAKLLAAKYKDNLDRLVERIVRSSKTTNLQFANNIASVGGIGFFTHSATKFPDERFLEVVMAAPDTFESQGDYAVKFSRLFTLYGTELLSILSADSPIHEDKDVSGYGLNFTWRTVASQSGRGARVNVERAVAYFTKEKIRAFLRHHMSQNQMLADAVMFAGQEGGPVALISYRSPESQADSRPPIEDQTLAVGRPDAVADGAEPQVAYNRAPLAPQVSGNLSPEQPTVPPVALHPQAENARGLEDAVPATANSPEQSIGGAFAAEGSTKDMESVTAASGKTLDAPSAAMPSTTAATQSAPRPRKVLEGYVIQFVFSDKSEARRWGERIERRGYAVSISEAGAVAIRLRLGNFASREAAERQLRAFKEEGLSGVVINLPQPYRPDVAPGAATVKSANAANATE